MLSDLNYKKMSSSDVLKQIQNDYYKEQETKERKYEEYIGKIIEKNPYYIREKHNSETRKKLRRRTWIKGNEDHDEIEDDDIIEIEDNIDYSTDKKKFKSKSKKPSGKAIIISDDDDDNKIIISESNDDDNIIIYESNDDDNNIIISESNDNNSNIIISESNDDDDESSNSSQELIVVKKLSSNNRKRSRIIEEEEDDDEEEEKEEEDNEENDNDGKSTKKSYMGRSQKIIFDIINSSNEGKKNDNNNNNNNSDNHRNTNESSTKVIDEIRKYDQNFILGNPRKGRIKNYQLLLNKKKYRGDPIMNQKREKYISIGNKKESNINRNSLNELSSDIDTSNAEYLNDEILSVNSDENEISELDKKNKHNTGSIILFDDDNSINYALNNDENYHNKKDKRKGKNFNSNDQIEKEKGNMKEKKVGKEILSNSKEKSSRSLKINDMANQYFENLEKPDINNKNDVPKVKLGNLYDYVKVIKNLDNRNTKKDELKLTEIQSVYAPFSSTSLFSLSGMTNFDDNLQNNSLVNFKGKDNHDLVISSVTSSSTSIDESESHNEITTSSVTTPSITIQDITKNANRNNRKNIINDDSSIKKESNVMEIVNKHEESQKSLIDISTTPLPITNSNNNIHSSIIDTIKSSITIPSSSPFPSPSLMTISSLTSSIMSNKIIPFLFEDQNEKLSLSQEHIPLNIDFNNRNCIIQLLYSDFMKWFSKSLSFPTPIHLFQHLCFLPIQEMAKVKLSPYFTSMNAEIYKNLDRLGLNYYYNSS